MTALGMVLWQATTGRAGATGLIIFLVATFLTILFSLVALLDWLRHRKR
jgi:hypothetical protein